MTIKIHPVHTKKDYEQALAMIDKLWNAKSNTEEADALDVLTTLVEAYEQKHFFIGPADPIEAIKFRMEQMHLGKSDMAEILGGENRVSEILRKKRKLTLKMIFRLHHKLRIPYESLMSG